MDQSLKQAIIEYMNYLNYITHYGENGFSSSKLGKLQSDLIKSIYQLPKITLSRSRAGKSSIRVKNKTLDYLKKVMVNTNFVFPFNINGEEIVLNKKGKVVSGKYKGIYLGFDPENIEAKLKKIKLFEKDIGNIKLNYDYKTQTFRGNYVVDFSKGTGLPSNKLMVDFNGKILNGEYKDKYLGYDFNNKFVITKYKEYGLKFNNEEVNFKFAGNDTIPGQIKVGYNLKKGDFNFSESLEFGNKLKNESKNYGNIEFGFNASAKNHINARYSFKFFPDSENMPKDALRKLKQSKLEEFKDILKGDTITVDFNGRALGGRYNGLYFGYDFTKAKFVANVNKPILFNKLFEKLKPYITKKFEFKDPKGNPINVGFDGEVLSGKYKNMYLGYDGNIVSGKLRDFSANFDGNYIRGGYKSVYYSINPKTGKFTLSWNPNLDGAFEKVVKKFSEIDVEKILNDVEEFGVFHVVADKAVGLTVEQIEALKEAYGNYSIARKAAKAEIKAEKDLLKFNKKRTVEGEVVSYSDELIPRSITDGGNKIYNVDPEDYKNLKKGESFMKPVSEQSLKNSDLLLEKMSKVVNNEEFDLLDVDSKIRVVKDILMNGPKAAFLLNSGITKQVFLDYFKAHGLSIIPPDVDFPTERLDGIEGLVCNLFKDDATAQKAKNILLGASDQIALLGERSTALEYVKKANSLLQTADMVSIEFGGIGIKTAAAIGAYKVGKVVYKSYKEYKNSVEAYNLANTLDNLEKHRGFVINRVARYDACDYCKRLEGPLTKKTTHFHDHCRCTLEIEYIS